MDNQKSPLTWIILNLVSVIFALTLNFLAISLPLNNKTTGELSDAYPNYFVPAGFTFSIWGIIYLFMFAFLIYQAWQYRQNQVRTLSIIQAIGPWFLISGLANGSWIIAWHYEIVPLSLLIMLVIFYSLLKIYLILNQHKPHSLLDNIFIRLFFSIYLAWICVATIANVTTLCISMGINSLIFEGHIWAIIMAIIAAILGILMIYKKQDIGFAMVIIWALYGIFMKQSAFEDALSVAVANVVKYTFTMLIIYSLLNLVGKRSYFFEHR